MEIVDNDFSLTRILNKLNGIKEMKYREFTWFSVWLMYTKIKRVILLFNKNYNNFFLT